MFAAIMVMLALATQEQAKQSEEYKINCETLTAILMIQSSLEDPVYDQLKNVYLRKAIQEQAIIMQLLDRRETSYIMAKESDAESDLRLIRRRRCDLKDAPFVEEAAVRFPDRKLVNEYVMFNRAYRKTILERSQLEQDRVNIINAVVIETDECYKHWDAMRDARCEFYYITVRRTALLKFKTAMLNYKNAEGISYWETGEIPPSIPYWRFNEGK
jgi:hypothetical protein